MRPRPRGRPRGHRPQADGKVGARSGPSGGERPGSERLVGIHPVREALRARRRTLDRLWIRRGERRPGDEVASMASAARAAGVPVEELEAARFDVEAPEGVPHQGVMLEAGPVPEVPLDALIGAGGAGTAASGPLEPCWLVALDGVEDPQNLGAILRVADAAGARGVLLPERRVAPLSPSVSRASAGALEHVPIARVTNLTRALGLLKDEGFWIHGADPAAEQDLFEASERLFDRRLVLVVGAEGKGIRPGVRSALDVRYRIPMGGAVASLNVAAATAVVLFEWVRRARLAPRRDPPPDSRGPAGDHLDAILPGGARRL